MTKRILLLPALLVVVALSAAAAGAQPRLWVTTPARDRLLADDSAQVSELKAVDPALTAIVVDAARQFQPIDGFGFALTGGSAQHLMLMEPALRHELLEELFATQGNAIGISYLRLSIGSSDLNERTFSYDDLPAGETDVELKHFSLADDRSNVIPVLREILSINPKIKILGSPWSAPLWMKTNQNIQGGKLKPEYYSVYAHYFAKYIQAMAAEGITIDAITVQNEPFNDLNTPSMQFFAKEEAAFIRDHLGPVFREQGIRTKIILYDHNCDAPEFPLSVLNDDAARPFVDGSGFHLYAGPISALSVVHDAFPDKSIYFTEMMAVNRGAEFNIAGPVARILIGATRNWSRNVILWNLAADAEFKPHTDNGGCSMCQGAVTLEGNRVTRNVAYYVIGHASRFVPQGSVRIASTSTAELPDVAFRTPDGKTAMIVANPGPAPQRFQVIAGERTLLLELPAGAVGTLVW